MKPVVSVTFIICGTLVAAMPIIARRMGLPLADVESLCYFALAAIMILSAIAGAMMSKPRRSARGFDPIPVATAA